MRTVARRGSLPDGVSNRLLREISKISAATDPVAEASARYDRCRRAAWFRPVVEELVSMAGEGARCMFCSGSEAGQVEHFRPKATYPNSALQWMNMLWVCGICNLAKRGRFNESSPPINPVDETVWDYLFIDEFGALSPRWNDVTNDLDPRAVVTIELLRLDRQALQESRHARLKDLRERALDTIALFSLGELSAGDIQDRLIEWYTQSFQPDVADYFFSGPGAQITTEPFRRLLEIANS